MLSAKIDHMHSSACVMKTACSIDVGLQECGALSKVKSYVISQPLAERQIRLPLEKARGHHGGRLSSGPNSHPTKLHVR